MRSPRVHLLILAVLLAAGNVAWTFMRSGVPFSLEGTVERIEVRREKHPGLDDVHLVTIGGQTLHVDADVAGALREGDRVSKQAWSWSLSTPREQVRLGLSNDARGMLVAMPLLVLLGLVALRWGARSSAQ
ncbi:MAG: hypothetical protein R3F05_21005 [Planctomycetota bacterium]